MANKYLLGLDLGTDSVGWCLTDENDKIVRKCGKSLWGVRLFDAALPAADRRAERIARRRLARRSERIDILQSLFFDEMKKVDPTFFLRLDNATFHEDDKDPLVRGKDGLLFTGDYNDAKYYAEFPTIYHLREELFTDKKKADLRLIYLAMHHMVKYRGNFLMDNLSADGSGAIEGAVLELNSALGSLDKGGLFASDSNFRELKKIATGNRTITSLKEGLKALFKSEDKYVNDIVIRLIAGGKVDSSKIFDSEDDIDPSSICVAADSFDSDFASIQSQFMDRPEVDVISAAKKMHDCLVLWKLLGESKNISSAMVERYDNHKKDLAALRKYVKANMPEKYDEVFREYKKGLHNYVTYIGSTISGNKRIRCEHCKQDEFYSYIKTLLGLAKIKNSSEISDPYLRIVFDKISSGDYLPRQNSTDNGVFPYQLNLAEMKTILTNQSAYYPFLLEKDEDGLTIIDKIESILTYRIPYFVGPLMEKNEKSNRSLHSWMVRKAGGEIKPWNIADKVDFDKSAELFIQRMLNRCSYLRDCYCLPSSSILFSEYNVFSYLNKIYVNGSFIKTDDKLEIYESLFLKKKTVTVRDIESFFKKKYGKDANVTTSNDKPLEKITASMGSYVTFSSILGKDYVDSHRDQIEDIIRDLTIFQDNATIEKRLKNVYGFKDAAVISKIKPIRYTGWGRLSKEFLLLTTKKIDESTGEIKEMTFLDVLKNTNLGLMEIINDSRYEFGKKIAEHNGDENVPSDPKEKMVAMRSFIDEQYISPGMKRPLIQTMEIIDELEKIIAHPIDEYYIEFTRTDQAHKERTKSRQARLLDIYAEAEKNVKSEIKDALQKKEALATIEHFAKEVKSTVDINSFRSDKLFLYYLQLGKCMYTLKPIELGELNDNSKYDIDHIVPRAMIKDDSLSNRVLVSCGANRYKKDIFPIPSNMLAPNAMAFYTYLHRIGFMDDKKLGNLTRKEPMSDDELAVFVSRQLVFTNQAVKATADTIKTFERTSNGAAPLVVYSKAENVSDFRKQFELVKSRDANNFHHAHDAYLNIVVGRRVSNYFGGNNPIKVKERIAYLKNAHMTMNVEKIFTDNSKAYETSHIHLEPVKDSSGGIIWDYATSMAEITKNIYSRFDIMVTTREYIRSGALFKATVHKASEDKDGNLVPLKSVSDSPYLFTDKYGGYSDVTFGFYSLIEAKDKKDKSYFSIEAMPNLFVNPADAKSIESYLRDRQHINLVRVVIPCLRVNTIIEKGKSRFAITGKTGTAYFVKNLNNAFFSKEDLATIRIVSKFIGLLAKNRLFIKDPDFEAKVAIEFPQEGNEELTVSVAKSEKAKALVLTSASIQHLFVSLEKKLNSEMMAGLSGASIIGKLLADPKTKQSFDGLTIAKQAIVLSEILKAVGTTRETSDLSLMGLGSFLGGNCIQKTSLSGCRIVVESITGFYTKVVWECPK